MRHIFIAFRFCLTLVGAVSCTDDPLMHSQIPDSARRAEYPKILPLHDFLVSRPDPIDVALLTGNLPSRAAALRARASRFRAPIVDNATHARMQTALARR